MKNQMGGLFMSDKQYELIANRYDKRLASIQTVIAFYTVFITTLILILCDGLNIYELLYFHNVVNHFHDYSGRIVVCFIVSILGVIDTFFTICSVISQRKSCFELKSKLLEYEIQKEMETIHDTDEIVIPIEFTLFCFSISLVLFIVVFIYLFLLLLSQLYI